MAECCNCDDEVSFCLTINGQDFNVCDDCKHLIFEMLSDFNIELKGDE